MIIYPDCFPCFMRQSTIAFSQAGIGEPQQVELLKDVAKEIAYRDVSSSPAHVTTHIHRLIRSRVGRDPFKNIKSLYNQKALGLYNLLKERIVVSGDPLLMATRLSIAGNIIDFGIFSTVDIEGTIERALGDDIAIDDYEAFRRDIENASQVLVLLDNAGEIVFDRLLIEAIMDLGCDVTAVVKGAPVLNDAIMDDAVETGLSETCRVIENGSDAVGTIVQWCSDDFVRELMSAEMVISKGQGNFETLMNERLKNVYFLFQAKCDVVARYLGLDKGAMVLSRGTDRWRLSV